MIYGPARFVPLLMVASTLAAIGVDRAAREVSIEVERASRGREEGLEAPMISASGFDVTPLDAQVVKRLAAELEPEAYRVTQRAGTEAPFCGALLHNDEEGLYSCAVCDLPLFHSADKYDSGSGWPSFTSAVDPEHVAERRDRSHGTVRTEIGCARCDAHLGHVFPDGPPPAGLRYCLNSAALDFEADTPSASDS